MMTGESMRRVRARGLKVILEDDSEACWREVPCFQLAGSLSVAAKGMSSVGLPGGYRTGSFQVPMEGESAGAAGRVRMEAPGWMVWPAGEFWNKRNLAEGRAMCHWNGEGVGGIWDLELG